MYRRMSSRVLDRLFGPARTMVVIRVHIPPSKMPATYAHALHFSQPAFITEIYTIYSEESELCTRSDLDLLRELLCGVLYVAMVTSTGIAHMFWTVISVLFTFIERKL